MTNDNRLMAMFTILAGIICWLSAGTIKGQDKIVPGRIIIEFIPGVVQMAPGVDKAPVNQSTVVVPDVLQACESIEAIEIEKLFPMHIPGQTEEISPITGKISKITDLSQYYVLKFSLAVDVKSAISCFSSLSQVKSVSPDFYPIIDVEPNDPGFVKQWYLKNTVDAKFDIDAIPAWDITKGDNVIIALIEEGIKTNHEDLASHVYTGTGTEYGCDTTTSSGRHGTYVAGIAAAVTNNSKGIAGVAWNGLLMPRKGVTVAERARDIDSSSALGAKVINNSWHIHTDEPYLRSAIRNAFNRGAVLTGSMGNDPPPHLAYPAAYDSFVIACGALLKVNNGDTLYVRPDQNQGAFIDVTAPGDSLWTTCARVRNPAYGYYWWFGMTSGSTPQVSAEAALLFAANPNLANLQIMDIIKRTAILFSGWENYPNAYGSGMINCYQASLLGLAYANKSASLEATTYNNGRRLIRDGNGRYHLVFQSGGEIFYRRSNVGGTSWETPVKLSSSTGNNKFPSLTGTSSKQFVVWQRYAGLVSGQHKYDTYFAKNTGSGWSTTKIASLSNLSFSTQTDPLPVITYCTNESGVYRVLVCAKTSSGIQYVTSANDGSTWSSSSLIPDASASHKNQSLSMGPTTPPVIAYIAYDDGSNIYYNSYSGVSGGWGPNQSNVSAGSGSTNNQFPSVEKDDPQYAGANFAWQGYSPALQADVIVYRRDYGPFQLFEGQDDADRPSVTTHATNKRSIVYYTSDWKKVYRKYYNGSTWSHLLVASNATHPNISAGTTTAKYIWLSGSTSPYEIKLSTETLPLGGLAKLASTGTDAEVMESKSIYHRSAVLQDQSLATLLWVEFGEVVLKNANDSVRPIEFVPIDESRFEPTQENVLGYLETLPFDIGKDATVLQWEQNLYGRSLSPLAAVESQDMVIDFQLVEAATGKVLATLTQGNFTSTAAETRFQGTESRDVSAYAGNEVKLRVVASGLKSNAEGITAGVVEVHLDPSRGAGKGNQGPFKSTADVSLPQSYELNQNWPNPFNSTTAISYALPKAAHVSLQLFNVRGQLVRVLVSSHKPAGRYQALWDGKDDLGHVVASGVYIYRLHAGEYSEVKKMALLR